MGAIPSAETARRFEAARAAYAGGRAIEALRLLEPVLAAEPRLAQARHLEGLCRIDLGQLDAAEAALRAAVALDRRDLQPRLHLAELLRRPTRFDDAERAYRDALVLDPRNAAALAGLAKLLIALSRYDDALTLTAGPAADPACPAMVLDVHAEALKHLGRMADALACNRRAGAGGGLAAVVEEPSILRELGRYDEAEAAARRALALVGPAPGALAAHGRTLQDLARHDEAEAAYRQALAQAPQDDLAHELLAELVLGRTGDPAQALRPLEAALATQPTPGLIALKARLLVRTGQLEAAYAVLEQAAAAAPHVAALHAAAAKTAMIQPDPSPALMDAALVHAERAYALAFDVPKVAGVLAEAQLAAGRPEAAGRIAATLLRRWPHNQALIALQALAWRLTGDPRYAELCDYANLVGGGVIDTPPGWPSLTAYLSDLAQALAAAHAVPVDAFGMARRDGVQTRANLTPEAGAAIAAFYAAIEAPIRQYVTGLGRGPDLLRRRNQGGHRVKAAWSIRTDPGGYQGSHLHTEGWLSSAFYVALPPAVERGGREGWLKFGEPALPTRPRLEAEHWVKPKPGLFVLFPSYLWHGTERFTGEGVRLILSVDVAPAPPSR